MTKTTRVFSAAFACVLLSTTSAVVNAKNPNSNGNGNGPTHTPGIPQGQGQNNSAWSTPPGRSSEGKREGWENATPPGWTNNDGQRKGWDNADTPPGIEKR